MTIRRKHLMKTISLDTELYENLKRKAKELDDYMAAQRSLSDKHYRMMDRLRDHESSGLECVFARGWLRYESDFGDALLKVMGER